MAVHPLLKSSCVRCHSHQLACLVLSSERTRQGPHCMSFQLSTFKQRTPTCSLAAPLQQHRLPVALACAARVDPEAKSPGQPPRPVLLGFVGLLPVLFPRRPASTFSRLLVRAFAGAGTVKGSFGVVGTVKTSWCKDSGGLAAQRKVMREITG